MSRIADKLLARIAGKAAAEAACSTTAICRFGHIYLRTCCLNQGCSEVRTRDLC
ncbi:hypothetical protein [Actinomadura decatromicini]|uniref:hypothetical protein n=1 Tax=Actinomadura decatromicini TaxID=2604572 RepID=UPI001652D4B3|nr:hypothetical protein [Actinomadura decatromicini]